MAQYFGKLLSMRTSWVVIGICFIALIYTVVADVWGVRFTTFDDARAAIWAYDNSEINTIAFGQGRLYFFYHSPFVTFGNSLWRTVAFDIVQHGGFALAIAFVVATLSLYISLTFGLLAGFIYLATLAVTWDHTLITSVPLFHYVVVVNMSATLMALYAYRRTGRWLWLGASLALYFLALWGQEYQIMIITALFIVCAFARLPGQAPAGAESGPDRRKMIRLCGAAISLGAAYAVAVIVWRLIYGNQYDGAEISAATFSLKHFLGVLLLWPFGTNIFAYIVHPLHVGASMAGNGFDYRLDFAPATVLANLDGLTPVKIAAVLLGGALLMRHLRRDELSRGQLLILPLLAGVIMLAPTFLLGLTPKYQGWFQQGTPAYSYSSISAYGVAILLAWLAVGVHGLVDGGAWRWTIRGGVVAVLLVGAVAADSQNNVVGRAMREATARWISLNMVLTSPLRPEIEDGTLYAPRLADYYWAVPGYPDYWRRLLKIAYGSKIVYKDAVDITDTFGDKSYYFDYAYLPESRRNVALLSKVVQEGNVPTTRQVRLISDGPLDTALAGVKKDGTALHVWLPRMPVQRMGKAFVYTVNLPESTPVAWLRVESQRMWAPPKALKSPIYKMSSPIDFSDRGNSRAFLGDGWSTPEAQLTWAVGSESEVRLLPSKQSGCDVKGTVKAWPFYVKDKSPDPEVTILVNGDQMWKGSIWRDTAIDFTIPAAVWNRDRFVSLKLLHPYARSPQELGVSSDGRKLALAVQSMTFQGCGASEGAPYELGDTIDFRDVGNAKPYMTEGWSDPERDLTWAIGPQSSLVLGHATVPACDVVMEISASAHALPPKLAQPPLTVEVNGKVVGDGTGFDAQAAKQSFTIDRMLWLSEQPARIRFNHPYAKSPKDLGTSQDPRPLAFAFRSLSVKERCRSGLR
ncbi:hypothetical protein [Paramagnetospirillum magneticum]|uniref:Uncharacterized protein n=1 Tax=Paramagnetospirillum magneticum (strain ATCC 700264 / AMB-1) TaxID=342108 RepID=Q2W8E6_PARM1|nr:hypothetical protein [Paramagnetospirillum magneticum]BAE49879.1 hypothetical protein amb1075 [Paramagnetospirillum magneticum AMB-1]